ncbi:putative immunity protein [Bremerella sp. P1]|uniref:putative immunity protein n=1 Tax=Bremerella sp. P1 TaxID=3026424 RepID=UPI003FCE2733
MLDDSVLHRIGCDFAEHVLPQFESVFENDRRPREAIEAKRNWLAGEINLEQLYEARSSAWYSSYFRRDSFGRPVIPEVSVIDAIHCAALSAGTVPRASKIAACAAGYYDNKDVRVWQVECLRELLNGNAP